MIIYENSKRHIFDFRYVFRSWGRVGTTIGGNKTEDFHEKNEALENFQVWSLLSNYLFAYIFTTESDF